MLLKLVLVDFVHRNGQRLFINSRVHQWSNVVEQATLVQCRVVVVDLTSTLGCEDDQLVLGELLRSELLVQQVVDRWADNAFELLGHVLLLDWIENDFV